jgi:hypothetical protein
MWRKPEEILISVRDNKQTAAKTANGIGKTTMAAAIVLWALECFPECIVLTTGSNWNTLSNVLWPKINLLIQQRGLFKDFPDAKILNNGIWLTKDRYAISRSTNKPEGLMGIHSPKLIQIVEESSGIQPTIAAAIAGNATGANDRRLYLGNPIESSGVFHEWCHSTEVNTITVSAFEHPNVVHGKNLIPGAVTREAIQANCAEWGTKCIAETPGAVKLPWNDDWYLLDYRGVARLLGQFPQGSHQTLIPRYAIEQAMQREKKPGAKTVIGIDPAASEFGDETVLSVNTENGVLYQEYYTGVNQMEIAGYAIKLKQRYNASQIGVDASGGFGGGVIARLRELGHTCLAIEFGAASSDQRRWANLKGEMYYLFMEQLTKNKEYFLPNDPILLKQACDIRVKPTSKGQDAIEPKDEFKKRHQGNSPDRLEAAIIGNYVLRFGSVLSNLEYYLPPDFEEEPEHVRNVSMFR